MSYRVYWEGQHPKPKRQFYKGEFEKRQQARRWCRDRAWLPGLVILHPDGTEEPYTRRN